MGGHKEVELEDQECVMEFDNENKGMSTMALRRAAVFPSLPNTQLDNIMENGFIPDSIPPATTSAADINIDSDYSQFKDALVPHNRLLANDSFGKRSLSQKSSDQTEDFNFSDITTDSDKRSILTQEDPDKNNVVQLKIDEGLVSKLGEHLNKDNTVPSLNESVQEEKILSIEDSGDKSSDSEDRDLYATVDVESKKPGYEYLNRNGVKTTVINVKPSDGLEKDNYTLPSSVPYEHIYEEIPDMNKIGKKFETEPNTNNQENVPPSDSNNNSKQSNTTESKDQVEHLNRKDSIVEGIDKREGKIEDHESTMKNKNFSFRHKNTMVFNINAKDGPKTAHVQPVVAPTKGNDASKKQENDNQINQKLSLKLASQAGTTRVALAEELKEKLRLRAQSMEENSPEDVSAIQALGQTRDGGVTPLKPSSLPTTAWVKKQQDSMKQAEGANKSNQPNGILDSNADNQRLSNGTTVSLGSLDDSEDEQIFENPKRVSFGEVVNVKEANAKIDNANSPMHMNDFMKKASNNPELQQAFVSPRAMMMKPKSSLPLGVDNNYLNATSKLLEQLKGRQVGFVNPIYQEDNGA